MGCSVSKGDVVTRPTIPDPGIRKKKVNKILEKAKQVHVEVYHHMRMRHRMRMRHGTRSQSFSGPDRNDFLTYIEEVLEEIAWAFPRVCWQGDQIVHQLQQLTDEEQRTILCLEYDWWCESFESLESFQNHLLALKQSILRSNLVGIFVELDALEEDNTVVDTAKRIPLPVSSGKPFACPTDLRLARSTAPQPTNTA